jgi:hypothetical protein
VGQAIVVGGLPSSSSGARYLGRHGLPVVHQIVSVNAPDSRGEVPTDSRSVRRFVGRLLGGQNSVNTRWLEALSHDAFSARHVHVAHRHVVERAGAGGIPAIRGVASGVSAGPVLFGREALGRGLQQGTVASFVACVF